MPRKDGVRRRGLGSDSQEGIATWGLQARNYSERNASTSALESDLGLKSLKLSSILLGTVSRIRKGPGEKYYQLFLFPALPVQSFICSVSCHLVQSHWRRLSFA